MNPKENKMAEFLTFSCEVKTAITENKPVLALESTVITHGLPNPRNIEVALQLEQTARTHGALPATIAILNGKVKIGLSHDEIAQLASCKAGKASVRDLSYVIANKQSAGTTVALTAKLASLVGIRVFATGGIGGVHYGDGFDVSADLFAMTHSPIAIVSAGPKAILDIGRTIEILDSLSVPVIGFQTKFVPAFYSAESPFRIPYTIDSIDALVHYINIHQQLQLKTSVMIMNPVPKQVEIPSHIITPVIQQALITAQEKSITGKEITPFLLAELNKLTNGGSVKTNIALLNNNVELGAKLARKLS